MLAELARRFGEPPLYARIDMLADAAGAPRLLELEAVEPCLYFNVEPDAAERMADAVLLEAG